MEGVSDTLGVTLEVRMDDILQREGLKFVDIVGWPQPYPQSYSGWVRFIGDSHVLYMAHGRASADRKITCAVLIDRQGHVADHLSCSVDSFQGYVVPYFATDADGGTLLLSGEDRLTPAEFTLKHRDGVEVFQPDPPYTIKRGVIRFRVVDGKLQITERPSGPGVDGKR